MRLAGLCIGFALGIKYLAILPLLVLVGYLVTTFGLLAVVGTAPSGNPFAMVLAVKIALGLMEDVYDHGTVIHDDPLAKRIAVNGSRANVVLLQFVFDLAGDRFQVWF